MFKKIAHLSCALALLAAGSIAMAADTGGEVRGVVQTESGELVAGAEITLTHGTKGIERVGRSNSDGEFTFTGVPIGPYTMVVSREGYSRSESRIAVQVGRPVVLQATLMPGNVLDEVVVVASVIETFDMAETTAGISFDAATVDLLPLDDGFKQMVLLAPGSVENGAPGAFRGASSIGGASSAENGYYLNGINITQIQSGLGSFRMPWEAIAQVNVQTSGMGASFGGALGGIVNAVSKTGTNEFLFGGEARFDSKSLSSAAPSVRSVSDPDSFWINNQRDEFGQTQYSIWASGPIIKDRAFFYALYNPLEEEETFANNTTLTRRTIDSDRWYVNLEWYLNDNHFVGFTTFNTEREGTDDLFDYNANTDEVLSDSGARSFFKDGGQFYGFNYHGDWTDNLSASFVLGRTEEEEVPVPANDLVLVQDCSSGSCFSYSDHSDSTIQPQEFSRDQIRLDVNWQLSDHGLSVGFDSYEIDVFVNNRQNGVFSGDPNDVETDAALGWWLYGISGTDSTLVGGVGVTANQDGVPAGTEFVRRRVRNRFSDSTVESFALYAEDSWQVADDLTLNLGVRVTDFKNTVSSGEAYADLDGNVAPRIAAIWDVGGQGTRKVFASTGRYYQPVAARMNITQGSSSIEYFDYYEVVSPGDRPALRADGSPERGAQIGSRIFRQRGITDPNLIASGNLEAMYSDQFSLGYSQEVFDGNMTASIRGVYNELGRSVEDTDYGPVLTNVLTDMGFIDPNDPARDELSEIPPFQGSFYILANPGDDVEIAYDFDGDGTVDEVTLTQEDLQLPTPERKYLAVQLELEGSLTERFNFFSSYTWSHSYGNTEGLVKTTNGQADPGWTSDYDYGESLDHAYGNLPNDRRHSFKFSGLYDINESWIVGATLRAASGRPLNVLVPHPLGVDGCAPNSPWAACASRSYVGAFYDENGNPVKRGSAGELDWSHNIDVSLTYRRDVGDGRLTVKGTVFNLLDSDAAIDVEEWAGPDYNLPDTYQTPRYVSLMARYEF